MRVPRPPKVMQLLGGILVPHSVSATHRLPMTCILAVLTALTAATGHAETVSAQCRDAAVPERRIEICSAAATSTSLSSSERAAAFYFSAVTHLDLKRPDAAVSDLSQSIALAPDFWPARWVRAEISASRRNYAEAVDDLIVMTRRNPQLTDALRELSIAQSYAGRHVEAIDTLTKAIDLAGDDGRTAANLLTARGIEREALGQFPDALGDYAAALSKDASKANAMFSSGRASLMNGNPDDAVTMLAKAVDADPSDGYPVLWLYLAETRAGKDGLSGMRTRAAKLTRGVWPEPIVRVLLGELEPPLADGPTYPGTWTAELLNRAGACEVSFFLGQQQLLAGNAARAKGYFQTAVDTGIHEFIEHRLARLELARMAGGSR